MKNKELNTEVIGEITEGAINLNVNDRYKLLGYIDGLRLNKRQNGGCYDCY